ncbi:N-acetylglucosamine-6-phosphate deacetylase [Propioniferax innocua]|uniref:N-acetylglucosamine 6-phosphate deacetylase n=1 Tax=Propioniferax innocua TaxID=1753 RepID=A0A542ZC37_9ACTN|nr:N-acetylglucosamine-6-phosphate deacetylase [Propioniferax innocua]TQL57913.1 N-acetylglucosamine 6-phosphate deacetylase [Propioniferax innocua]
MPELQISKAVVGSGADSAVAEQVRVEWSDDGIITAIETDAETPTAGWAVPGFVDTHTHGAMGKDFGKADLDGAREILDHHHRHGATTVFASMATDTVEHMAAQARVLADLCRSGELDGIHLEGPFLAEERKGAHSAELLCDPKGSALFELIDACGGHLAMVTLAPERDGGIDAVRELVQRGVVVAFGHSDADAATTASCIEAGATVATHLFNAMPGIHHRSPGPIPALLTDPTVMCELIIDGVHVHRDVAQMVVQTAGADRVALVTDSMEATGLGDGRYGIGALTAQVTDGVARIVETDGSVGAIAGSTLTIDDAFARMVGWGLPVEDVAHMAATTPARFHGRDDVGVLEVGRRADLVVVDDSGRLQHVLRRGEWIR